MDPKTGQWQFRDHERARGDWPGSDHLSLEEWRVIESAKRVALYLDGHSQRITLDTLHDGLRANVKKLIDANS